MARPSAKVWTSKTVRWWRSVGARIALIASGPFLMGAEVDWRVVDVMAQRDIPRALAWMEAYRGELGPVEAYLLGVWQIDLACYGGRHEKAEAWFAQLEPESLPPEARELGVLLHEGVAAFLKGQRRTAGAKYAEAYPLCGRLEQQWFGAWLAEKAANLFREFGTLDEIQARYAEAADRWREVGDASGILRIEVLRGYVPGSVELTQHLGDLENALGAFEAGARWRDLAAVQFMTAFVYDQREAEEEAFRRTLELAQEAGDAFFQANAWTAIAQSTAFHNDFDEAMAAIQKASQLANRLGPLARWMTINRIRAKILVGQGTPQSLRDAELLLLKLVGEAEAGGYEEALCYLRYHLARCYRAQGRPEEAEVEIRAALAFVRERGEDFYLQDFLALLRRCLEDQERWQEALVVADQQYVARLAHWSSGEASRVSLTTARHEADLRKVRIAVAEQEKALAESRLSSKENELLAAREMEAHKRLILHSVLALMGITTVASVILAILYRHKRRAQRKIADLVELLTEEKSRLALEVANHRQLARELQETNERLREVDAHRRQILSLAAHDMRNPLAAIEQCVELLGAEVPTHTTHLTRELFQLSRTSTTYLNELLEQVVKARRDEDTHGVLAPQWLEVLPIVSQIAAFNQVRAQKKGMRLEVVPESAPPTRVWADARALRSCVDNLVSNAIKFSPLETRIVIRLIDRPETLLIMVEDEGPGLTAEDLSQLFSEFGRLSARTTGGESSTGLGLHSVKQKMAGMGGRVFAENRARGGARFILELKRDQRAAHLALHRNLGEA